MTLDDDLEEISNEKRRRQANTELPNLINAIENGKLDVNDDVVERLDCASATYHFVYYSYLAKFVSEYPGELIVPTDDMIEEFNTRIDVLHKAAVLAEGTFQRVNIEQRARAIVNYAENNISGLSAWLPESLQQYGNVSNFESSLRTMLEEVKGQPDIFNNPIYQRKFNAVVYGFWSYWHFNKDWQATGQAQFWTALDMIEDTAPYIERTEYADIARDRVPKLLEKAKQAKPGLLVGLPQKFDKYLPSSPTP